MQAVPTPDAIPVATLAVRTLVATTTHVVSSVATMDVVSSATHRASFCPSVWTI